MNAEVLNCKLRDMKDVYSGSVIYIFRHYVVLLLVALIEYFRVGSNCINFTIF